MVTRRLEEVVKLSAPAGGAQITVATVPPGEKWTIRQVLVSNPNAVAVKWRFAKQDPDPSIVSRDILQRTTAATSDSGPILLNNVFYEGEKLRLSKDPVSGLFLWVQAIVLKP